MPHQHLQRRSADLRQRPANGIVVVLLTVTVAASPSA
jgi:hypothetical protein